MNAPMEPGDRRPADRAPRVDRGAALERPPGERYAPRREDAAGEPRPPTVGRAIAIAGAVALGGAVLLVVLGGVFTVSAGLLVVAAIIGWGAGQAVGRARGSLAGRGRVATAIALAVAAIALAQVGLWLYAQTEGGRLGLLDYLGQTWGALIPLQALLAAVAAWWSAR